MKMALIMWLLFITGVINEAVASRSLECSLEQKVAGCCEESAFAESSEGNIEWIMNENGNGGDWEPGPNFIRFNIANDKQCNGTSDKRQKGSATIEFDSSESKTIVLSMEGQAEARYEFFELFVDNVKKALIQAKNGPGCQASTCNMCNVTMDEKEIVLEPGHHTIRVNVDTKDGKYHNNAYFKITFAVKKQDVCKSCKCPVDCVWSRWFIGQCSKSCEGGDRTNVRYKEVVERYGGICSGEFTLIEPCNTDPCPVVDMCAAEPCQNGGTCNDVGDGHTCDCASGYEGQNCEIESIECYPNPCQNGGTCNDHINSYTCTCAPGFTGTDCETKTPPPDTSPLTFNKTCCEENGVSEGCMNFCKRDTSLRSLAPPNDCAKWEDTIAGCVVNVQCHENIECPDERPVCVDGLCEGCWTDDQCIEKDEDTYCNRGSCTVCSEKTEDGFCCDGVQNGRTISFLWTDWSLIGDDGSLPDAVIKTVNSCNDDIFGYLSVQDYCPMTCPVDGNWGAWSSWSSCSKTCDTGIKTRTRSCDDPAPVGAGADCVGDSEETLTCLEESCITLPECKPYLEEACEAAAKKLGRTFKIGTWFGISGCYYYKTGKYTGYVYFSLYGKVFDDKKKTPAQKNQFRPKGYDCKTECKMDSDCNQLYPSCQNGMCQVQRKSLFHKIQLGTSCSAKGFNEIESPDECKAAGTKLGLKWKGAGSWKGDFPACFHAEDGRNTVYFNDNQNPGRTNLNQRYAAICKEKEPTTETTTATTTETASSTDSEFIIGNASTLCKMEARVLHIEECKRAAKQLGLEITKVEWTNAPGGCFEFNGLSVKFNILFDVGYTRRDSKPICLRVQRKSLLHKIQLGTLCSAKGFNEIESADECKAAGTKLGLKWKGAGNWKGDFPACFHAEDVRNTVYFNENQSPGRTNLNQRYAAICKEKVTETCEDGIQNQDEEKTDCGGSCPACPDTTTEKPTTEPTSSTDTELECQSDQCLCVSAGGNTCGKPANQACDPDKCYDPDLCFGDGYWCKDAAWVKVADKKECGGSEVNKGRKETLDECAKTCLGISAMFIYGTNDFGSPKCNKIGNKDCLCYCETSPVVNGECQMEDIKGFKLYRHVHGKELNEHIDNFTCPSGYDAVSEDLGGTGKEWAQPNPDSSRTISDCASICDERQGCTGFEFAEGDFWIIGSCGTYTGGDGNKLDDDGRLRLDSASAWRSCIKSSQVTETCEDGIQNQDEEKTDCGGSCPACPVQRKSLLHKIQLGTLCSAKGFNEIESADKCKAAGTKLGLKWKGAGSWKGDFPACFHAEDGRNTVYFNENQNPGRTNLNQNYAAICKEKEPTTETTTATTTETTSSTDSESCMANSDCSTHYCGHGACKECQSGDECKSEWENEPFCVYDAAGFGCYAKNSWLADNPSCTNNDECFSGICESKQCKRGNKKTGDSCESSEECTSYECDSGTCY